jgi:hypothetical protein
VELVDELDDVLKLAALDNKTREGTEELTPMLKGNLEKVVQHGQRADSIVKSCCIREKVRGSAAQSISTSSSRTASILRTTAPGQSQGAGTPSSSSWLPHLAKALNAVVNGRGLRRLKGVSILDPGE